MARGFWGRLWSEFPSGQCHHGHFPHKSWVPNVEFYELSIQKKVFLPSGFFSKSSDSSSCSANMKGMIYLSYGDEGVGLLVTPGQVFLTANQRLVPASKLTIGDQLLSKDGKSVPIRAISVGNYHGGVHHIATESDSTFGNYLIIGGVWVGSYKIEIFYNSANLKDIYIFQDWPLR